MGQRAGSGDSGPLPMPTDHTASSGSSLAGASSGATGTGGDDRRGKSTGYETLLGKLFVERGFITPEELEVTRSLQKHSIDEDAPAELGDLLVSKSLVTRNQLERIRGEVDAEKSTQQIPGYKIKKKLGHGAMATVFLAKQLSLDRLVAIKVLPSKFSNNDKFIERFYKEGRAAAQLNHPHIVAAYDVGKAGDHHYFVMEYVDGDTVHDRIARSKRFPEADAIEIVRQVAEALKHAHDKGFIHRDIKPKNIMLSQAKVAKLADLGLARAVSDKEAAEAEAGRAYGTPYYISPEQIRGEVDIGPPADIYGLGATFYHMVTGKVPFEGRNPSSVMHKHLKQELIPPDHVYTKVSAGAAQVIEMMMQKSRSRRYQSADDLLVDLNLIAKGEPPHFAKAGHDISRVASRIEEGAVAGPLAVQDVPRKQGGLPLSDPMFLLAAGTAIVSVLVNIVLIVMLASGSSSSPSPTASNGNEDTGAADRRAVVIGNAPTLVGKWTSTSVQNLPGTESAILEFDASGNVAWTAIGNGKQNTANLRYVADADTITFKGSQRDYVWSYLIDGFTMVMRDPDGKQMTLRQGN